MSTDSFALFCHIACLKYALITTAGVHVNFFFLLTKNRSKKGKSVLKQMLHQTGHAGLCFNIGLYQKDFLVKINTLLFLHP